MALQFKIIMLQKVRLTALCFCKEDEIQKSHFEIIKGSLDPSVFDIRAYEPFNTPQFSVLQLEIMIGL